MANVIANDNKLNSANTAVNDKGVSFDDFISVPKMEKDNTPIEQTDVEQPQTAEYRTEDKADIEKVAKKAKTTTTTGGGSETAKREAEKAKERKDKENKEKIKTSLSENYKDVLYSADDIDRVWKQGMTEDDVLDALEKTYRGKRQTDLKNRRKELASATTQIDTSATTQIDTSEGDKFDKQKIDSWNGDAGESSAIIRNLMNPSLLVEMGKKMNTVKPNVWKLESYDKTEYDGSLDVNELKKGLTGNIRHIDFTKIPDEDLQFLATFPGLSRESNTIRELARNQIALNEKNIKSSESSETSPKPTPQTNPQPSEQGESGSSDDNTKYEEDDSTVSGLKGNNGVMNGIGEFKKKELDPALQSYFKDVTGVDVMDYAKMFLNSNITDLYNNGFYGQKGTEQAKHARNIAYGMAIAEGIANIGRIMLNKDPTDSTAKKLIEKANDSVLKNIYEADAKRMEKATDEVMDTLGFDLDEKKRVKSLMNDGDVKIIYDNLATVEQKKTMMKMMKDYGDEWAKLPRNEKIHMMQVAPLMFDKQFTSDQILSSAQSADEEAKYAKIMRDQVLKAKDLDNIAKQLSNQGLGVANAISGESLKTLQFNNSVQEFKFWHDIAKGDIESAWDIGKSVIDAVIPG